MRKTPLTLVLASTLLFSVVLGTLLMSLTEANFIPPIQHNSGIFIRSNGNIDPSTAHIQLVGNVYAGLQLAMPEEYLNYTISVVNGTLWAKIDGTYPMQLSPEYAFLELPMVYPTPPNTTNIHIWLDDVELNWSNFSEIDPAATHHTDIGNWQMIYALVAPSSPDFALKIHYEHPVQVINGTYTFLYDLNISPYLSPSIPNSTAHFSIRVETNCSGVNVYTTGFNGTWNTMNYTTAKYSNVETITFDIVSEYAKPLWGDIAVSLLNAQIPEFQAGIVMAAAVAAVTVSYAVFSMRARKRL